jgi:hypothetical protein
VRHLEHGMSHHETVKGDMGAWVCRSTWSSRATWEAWHVAPPNQLERHGSLGMSPHPVSWSDMDRRACRPSQSTGATWTTVHVAPRGPVERTTVSRAACCFIPSVQWMMYGAATTELGSVENVVPVVA